MASTAEGMPDLIARHSDTLLAVGVMGILLALIVPLPTPVLDVLITMNFAYVLLMLMVVLNIKRPLELSTYPSLLLIATLFRLALNVASTRLILLQADAGKVIGAFGQITVGGNMVVGLIIFFILTVIQFIVITKGAERISEVAARFTLDAMPGKQIAIDADLNAGILSEADARKRRQDIVHEADFYGAMDGATKYVRGDAIASIVIVLINIIGGFIIGLGKGMSLADAMKTYSVLTVGDGLVTQIPAVIMSTSAGILITKSASDKGLSRELGMQVFANPRAIGLATVVVFGFMFFPGLPSLPFFIMGCILLAIYSAMSRKEKAATAKKPAQPETTVKKESEEQTIQSMLEPDRVAVEVGYNLIQLIDPQKGGTLLDRIKSLRKKFAREFGLLVPKIRMLDNVELDVNRYRVKLGGQKIAEGDVYPGRMMAMKPDGLPEGLEGIKTSEPSFGLPVIWIRKGQKELAESKGCAVVDADSVFITHLSEVLRRHAHEIMNRQDVKALIENVKKDNPAIVEELIPNVLTLGQVQQVLANLLAEGIPINNLPLILERCGNYALQTKDPAILTELVRKSLGRVICARYSDSQGNMNVLSFDPHLEEEIRERIDKSDGQIRINLPPNRLRQIIGGISEQTHKAFGAGTETVIVTDSALRPHVRGLVCRVSPDIPVIAYDEISENVKIKNVGMIQALENDFASAPKPQATAASAAPGKGAPQAQRPAVAGLGRAR